MQSPWNPRVPVDDRFGLAVDTAGASTEPNSSSFNGLVNMEFLGLDMKAGADGTWAAVPVYLVWNLAGPLYGEPLWMYI